MKIHKDMWHYRLYRWWLEHKFVSKFGKYQDLYVWNDDGDDIEYTIEEAPDALIHERLHIPANLCLYIKAVLIYAPCQKIITNRIFRWSAINLALMGLIYFELTNSVVNDTMLVLGGLVSIVVLGLSIIIGILFICDKPNDIYQNRETKEKEPTFYKSVVKPYLKARKEKICPFLTFE